MKIGKMKIGKTDGEIRWVKIGKERVKNNRKIIGENRGEYKAGSEKRWDLGCLEGRMTYI